VRIIHLARKPLTGSVADNVLEHGAGAIHIDATRLQTGENTRREGGSTGKFTQSVYEGDRSRPTACGGHSGGRWPGNLVLEHLPGCRREGTRQVRNKGGVPQSTVMNARTVFGQMKKRTAFTHYFDPETGMETVADWLCVPDCPVADLDEQSGITRSSSHTRNNQDYKGYSKGADKAHTTFGPQEDRGGASRFFKQVGGDHE
jgi:hypothetical protein